MKYEIDYYSSAWLVFAETTIPVTEAPEPRTTTADRDRDNTGREQRQDGRGRREGGRRESRDQTGRNNSKGLAY